MRDVVNEKYTGSSQSSKDDGQTRPSSVSDSYIKYGSQAIQIVAASGVAGGKSQYSTSKNGGAGQYVSLSIANKDTDKPVAVVTWYDAVNLKLCMAYNKNPTTSNTWTKRIIDENGGINVKTVIDGNGGVHFAYYDNIHGSDLKYAYLPSYDSTEDPQIVVVDAYGAVGAKCTIDVAKDSEGNWVPYIGYQMNAYLGTPLASKVAYRTDFDTSKVPAGSDEQDRYTGAWEISIVPTSNIPKDDQINVGVYRNEDGYAQAFTSNSNWTASDTAAGSVITNSTLNVCNATIVKGNNTSNPILGYGIDTGAIEMAQKK